MFKAKNKKKSIQSGETFQQCQKDINVYEELFCHLKGKAENEHAFSVGQESTNVKLGVIGGGEANALRAVARLLCQRFPVL